MCIRDSYKTGGRIDLNQDVVDILIYQFANCFGDQYFFSCLIKNEDRFIALCERENYFLLESVF